MATRTTATVWNNSSDANFRAWGSWFSGCFTAFGWTATYSNFATGTNWTDVTAPAATNTARVTEVWAMADAGQATAPCYVKIEYGANTAAGTPGIRFVVATGHAGSGTMSGILHDSGATYIGPTVSNANSMTHYASGDSGRVVIAMSVSGTSWANTNTLTISVERRRNGSGAAQTTGFLIARKGSTTFACLGTLAASVHPNQTNTWAFPANISASSDSLFDGKNGVYPMLFCMGPSEIGLHIVAANRAGNPAGTTFTCTVLGASHTYLALQDANVTAIAGFSLITPCILYE